jgi:nicotinamide riboside transporter PnuC
MSRRLEWGGRPETPVKNPYRDTFAVYGVLAVVVVIVAWATGGSVGRAIVVALFFFVVASAWSVYRLRARNRRVEEADRREDGAP